MQKEKIKCKYFVIRAIKTKFRAKSTRSGAKNTKTRAIIDILISMIQEKGFRSYFFICKRLQINVKRCLIRLIINTIQKGYVTVS